MNLERLRPQPEERKLARVHALASVGVVLLEGGLEPTDLLNARPRWACGALALGEPAGAPQPRRVQDAQEPKGSVPTRDSKHAHTGKPYHDRKSPAPPADPESCIRCAYRRSKDLEDRGALRGDLAQLSLLQGLDGGLRGASNDRSQRESRGRAGHGLASRGTKCRALRALSDHLTCRSRRTRKKLSRALRA